MSFVNTAQDSLKVDKTRKIINENKDIINDTIFNFSYFDNGQISELTKKLNKNGFNVYYCYIHFYEDGKVAKFEEGVEKYDYSQSYHLHEAISYEINKLGDTNIRSKQWTKSRTEDYFTYIEFDDKKDTLNFYQSCNVKKEGLQISPSYGYYLNKNTVARMKTIWHEGKLKDILSENLIYTTASGKLISENEFIDLVNNKFHGQWEAYLVNIDPNAIDGAEYLDSPEEQENYYILLTFYEPFKHINDKKKVVKKWLKKNKNKI